MTFDRWIELITVTLGICGSVYGVLRVLLKPLTQRLEDVAESIRDTSNRLEQFVKDQYSIKETLAVSRGEHKAINQRIDELEDDVKELKERN
ncbi:hypothetical protein [Lentilactobacillus hilgardii]|uniref:Uncharacterized protein n=2 Tax=Lentilactobacillus hilgardii TaxID=1588 RepID=C0XGU9_LENH9|nr:hypothetical protein [Lentilactobacillus hilgardii]EEI25420.1 hypothetical protein HMPREF0519_0460 [Lentilactobacillus hilgardii DSM 20176 = ATCC 8290]KRK56869.1 hypothetical protein FD42_GL002604 [Lentilactobacillus hilgardii DSM 20176 = ATCC 8290]MCP9334465.1 hypothetical protein [Lentilactobacillus hilgardii]MCP9351062.1 hypothetical protein [Lentilactobacillus hilgardii]MCP9353902.1 hypothetical protein [Lentilactobacillus hilgardii]